MKPAAIFFAAIFVLTHYGYNRFSGVTAQWVFYAMRGIEAASLWAMLGIWAWQSRKTIWRTLLLGVCVGGIVEESETAACGFARIDMPNMPMPEHMDGLCGALTGIPLAGVQAALFVVFLASVLPWGKRGG